MQSYTAILADCFNNHEIRIPSKEPVFNGKYPGVFFCLFRGSYIWYFLRPPAPKNCRALCIAKIEISKSPHLLDTVRYGLRSEFHTAFFSGYTWLRLFRAKKKLGGGFKYFLFSPGSLGKWSKLTIFQSRTEYTKRTEVTSWCWWVQPCRRTWAVLKIPCRRAVFQQLGRVWWGGDSKRNAENFVKNERLEIQIDGFWQTQIYIYI